MAEFTAENYIHDVLNNEVTTCRLVKQAVKRHVEDLQKQNTEEFPYYFDPSAAENKISFSQGLRHTKGVWAKQQLKLTLEPWQQFCDWVVFGWKRTGSGLRRFTKSYIEVARKNGKTAWKSTDANVMFFMDGEAGAEVYFCATKRDQAKIAWGDAEAQIRKNPFLKSKTTLYKMNSTIKLNDSNSTMRPIGQDSDTEDGLNPSFVLVDEYHAHKSADLLNVMQDGMGARSQPLLSIITTAGFDKNLPCYNEERALVVGILEGTIEPRPENVFGIIYTLDEGDDWTDEKNWIKSNPNLGVSVNQDFLREQVKQALASPLKQNSVKTKNFNIWTQVASRWIMAEGWDACKGKIPDLIGRDCYCGLDLSTTTDITAWVKCFPPIDLETKFIFEYTFFLPNEGLLDKQRRDKVPYMLWRDKGLITCTPGNVIDYDFIEAHILKDAEDYQIRELAYDPYNSTEICNHLQNEGLPLVPFRQGFLSMSPPSKDFEKKILGKELNHGDNPVIKWMVSCTEIATDPAGNIKPVKPDRTKTNKRIDGVVASIMALDRAAQATIHSSAYETRGVLSL